MSGFLFVEIHRFSELVTFRDFLGFEISRFFDFAIFSVLLVCENNRFSDFVIFQSWRILRFLDFRIFWFLDWSMRGCFGFFIVWVSRCSGCNDFRK